MDYFLEHLIFELELQNFGITYEDLVPMTCSLKWTSDKKGFINNIIKYLYPRPRPTVDEQYLQLQSKIKNIVDLHWNEIFTENKEFLKIVNKSDKSDALKINV